MLPSDAPGDLRASRAYVAFGEPVPPGYMTLADAAAPVGFGLLTAFLRPLVESDRTAAITVVHYAVAAVAETLLVWLLEDGVLLDVGPADVGLRLEPDGASTSWLRHTRESAPVEPEREAGRIAWGLVGPIAAAAIANGPAPRRGTTMVALDALVAAARRTGRGVGRELDDRWVCHFLAGSGHPDHDTGRRLLVSPDAGPPVAYHVPRVCCVLNAAPSDHACPTCPQHGSDEVLSDRLRAMLQALSNDDFAAETGRARVADSRGPIEQAEE